jgi:anti-sigma-K factor RskA
VSEHDQVRELIEGYALAALDEQERAAVAAHLAAGCPDCAKALEEARWLVTQLVYLAPSAEPSASLRARVLQHVRSETPSAPVTEMRASARVKSTIPFWMWAGVAALLLVTAYSTWNAKQLSDKVTLLNAQVSDAVKERAQKEQELTAARHEAVILTDPESKKFTIWPNDKQMPRLEAAWHQNMGIYVTGQKVPMPGKNRVLQLWLISKSGKPMPSRTFWPDSKGKVDLMIDDPPEVMAQTKALAITEEPMGGSPQPTTTPMWVGGVS